jgi:hypothetical protein
MMAVVRISSKKIMTGRMSPSNFIEVVLESKSDGALSRKECYAYFFFQAVGAYASSDCSFTL